MERADPGDIIAGEAADAQMPAFGVERAEHRLAIGDDAEADPGADGEVDEIVAACAAPKRPSASAAPTTSVWIRAGPSTAAARLARTGVSLQPGLVVARMVP